MPTFSRHDIDAMAFKASKKFSEGVPLHDTVVKMSRDNSMNPEQIKRLVEAANTTTFLDKFNEKVGNHRMVEFDVADPSKVIDEALGSSKATQISPPSISITISVDSPDSSLHDSIEDENSYSPKGIENTSKVASYNEVNTIKLSSLTEETTHIDSHKLHKIKESLLDKVADCNYRASDIADSLAVEFRGIYTRDKYASLEIDALSSYGNKAIPALQMIRSRLGMNKISNSLSPQSAYILSDRHIVEGSSSLEKVAEIVQICDECNNFTSALDYVSKKYSRV